MGAFQLFGEHLHLRITDFKHLQLFDRRQNVIAAGARAAVTLPDVVQLPGKTEPPRVLAMAAVDNITKCVHALLRITIKPDPALDLSVDPGDLLASAEIFDCPGTSRGGHPIGDTAAMAAAIKPQHQPRFLRRSAVHERIDTQRAMRTNKAGIASLQKVKARPPHQRPISEDPEVLIALLERGIHRGRGADHGAERIVTA